MIAAGVGLDIPQKDYNIKVHTSLWSLDAQGPQETTEDSQQPPCVVCSCWAIVFPSHTPSGHRCLASASSCLLKLCWGKSTLAKPSAVPCLVENHSLSQAQGQFKLPQTGYSGHSYVVKFPFLGTLSVMGHLKCQTVVPLLVWDGTVPEPHNARHALLPPGSLEEEARLSWECAMSGPGFRLIPCLRNFRWNSICR